MRPSLVGIRAGSEPFDFHDHGIAEAGVVTVCEVCLRVASSIGGWPSWPRQRLTLSSMPPGAPRRIDKRNIHAGAVLALDQITGLPHGEWRLFFPMGGRSCR